MNRERTGKIFLYVLCDILFIELAFLAAMNIWYTGAVPGAHTIAIPNAAWIWWSRYMAIAAPIVSLIVFSLFKLYNNLWKYANFDEILKIFVSTTIVFIILYIFDWLFLSPKNIIQLSRRFLVIAWMIETILFSFSRLGYRALRRLLLYFSHILSGKAGVKRIMVIGAGLAGSNIVRGLINSRIRDRIPVIVVEKDPSMGNTLLMGVRVVSQIDKIEELAEKYKIDEIIIATPNSSNQELRFIINQCTQTNCTLKIIPPESDISDGAYNTGVRDVNISDLMYRDEVSLDNRNISDYLANRAILITGGSGSIGSELCRQIARFKPRLIVIYDFYENSAFELETEMESQFPQIPFYVRIGSVLDMERISETFVEFKPQVVFHAAAHKHVHFLEDSPSEAVLNNVFGTLNTARCADKYHAERFVLISTDKAVNPPNIYGATKRVCEMIVQRMSESGATKFMTVRFGNVLGSNGSIVHKFKWQIANGGPVTVTHPDMERFFMTIPEACQLVLQAAGLGKTGRIFVLNMGTPVNITELARNLIRLSGLKPDKDIKIIFTQPRPGEKIKEELLLDSEKENMQVTCNKKIFITKQPPIDSKQLDENLKQLYNACYGSRETLNKILKRIVPNYTGMDLRNDSVEVMSR
ncbi:MAG: polysaccharide biosynthesis protein [Clostridiales bacterium]|jgi:FlaA1/EpsC-like NDP-sugar epimerase|nr:polysaccharide biosynthesis protein [Clostridiales bacterium]